MDWGAPLYLLYAATGHLQEVCADGEPNGSGGTGHAGPEGQSTLSSSSRTSPDVESQAAGLVRVTDNTHTYGSTARKNSQ